MVQEMIQKSSEIQSDGRINRSRNSERGDKNGR